MNFIIFGLTSLLTLALTTHTSYKWTAVSLWKHPLQLAWLKIVLDYQKSSLIVTAVSYIEQGDKHLSEIHV